MTITSEEIRIKNQVLSGQGAAYLSEYTIGIDDVSAGGNFPTQGEDLVDLVEIATSYISRVSGISFNIAREGDLSWNGIADFRVDPVTPDFAKEKMWEKLEDEGKVSDFLAQHDNLHSEQDFFDGFDFRSAFTDGEGVKFVGVGNVTNDLSLMVHEIMHAIGLSHAGDYDIFFDPSDLAPGDLDSRIFSAMSYVKPKENGSLAGTEIDPSLFGIYRAGTPMVSDIMALKDLYPGLDVNSEGGTVHRFDVEGIHPAYAMTIRDDGGDNDVIDRSGATQGETINLGTGVENGSSLNGDYYNFFISYGSVIEDLEAGSGNDEIIGNAAANSIRAGRGADDIQGLGGNDLIFGDHPDDDIIIGAGQGDTIRGGDGEDTLHGGMGMDEVEGGADDDHIYGGSGGDGLWGNGGDDRIYGGAQSDDIFGGSGNDTLHGDAGDDVIEGEEGNDEIWGGAGADVFRFRAGHDRDVLKDIDLGEDHLDFGNAIAENIQLSDTHNGVRIESGGGDSVLLEGASYLDTLLSIEAQGLEDGALNYITGTSGPDNPQAPAGALIGSAGDDRISGLAGGDLIESGRGNDILTGGAGTDMFHFHRADFGHNTITDFEAGDGLAVDTALFHDMVQDGDDLVFSFLSDTGLSSSIRLVNPDFDPAQYYEFDLQAQGGPWMYVPNYMIA